MFTSVLEVVFFVSKSLENRETKETIKIYNFDPKASEPC